jgi:4-amino-4-deoxy-L-arabinose transferase-like glycosyltransferase
MAVTSTLERPAAAAPAPDAPAPPGRTSPLRSDRVALVAVTAVSFALNAWRLDLNGLGNQYYAAAARSMNESASNFFFVAFDPGGYLSVDKPPVALWIWAGAARLFGVSSWSLLLPGAVAGAAAVALLWVTVRRRFGVAAATVAAAVLALSPVNVAVNRLNLPEPFLVLFLVAAAWALLRSVDAPRARHALRWAALAGLFVGLAFNTKMLAAYVPLPALGLAVLAGSGRWRDRIARAATFGVTTLAVSASWLVAVDLTPASARPWVGGSTDDTVRNLVFGYNGLGRVEGPGFGGGGFPAGGPRGGFAGGMTGAGGVMGGSAGPLRLLGDAVGGQIAWLAPLAALGAAAGLWRHRRDASRRAAVVLWTGWLALYAVVFSMAGGTFHAYYTAVMAPAVAALVGIGAAAVVALARRSPAWLGAALAAGAATAALQLVLAGREPAFQSWTRPVLVLGVLGAAAAVAVAVARRRGRDVVTALAVGLAVLVVTPAAWAAHETAEPALNATLPQAGPRTGTSGSTFGSASSDGDPELAAWLRAANTGGEEWDLVVASAQTASGLIADEAVPVLALGGFMGTDPTTTVAGFADLVAAGRVRYVLTSGGGPGGGGFRGAGGGGSASRVISAAASACAPVTGAPPRYQGSLVDCAGQSAALAARA